LRPSGHLEVAPHRSRGRLVSFFRDLSDATADQSEGPSLPLSEGLGRLARVARPGTLVLVVSDFHDLDDDADREIGRLARRCDVACLLVHDALETKAPAPGDHRISDGDRVLRLPTGDEQWRREYAARFEERRARLEHLCKRSRAAFLMLRTGEDCQSVLRADVFARAFGGAQAPGGQT